MTTPEDIDLNDDADDDDSPLVTLKRNQIRTLEQKASRTDKAEQRAAKAERELAFAKTGHEFSEKQQTAVLSLIEGDLTAEAIRSAAKELGLPAPANGSWDSDGSDTDADLSALDRVNQAAAGSSTPPPKPPDMNQALRVAAGRA